MYAFYLFNRRMLHSKFRLVLIHLMSKTFPCLCLITQFSNEDSFPPLLPSATSVRKHQAEVWWEPPSLSNHLSRSFQCPLRSHSITGERRCNGTWKKLQHCTTRYSSFSQVFICVLWVDKDMPTVSANISEFSHCDANGYFNELATPY